MECRQLRDTTALLSQSKCAWRRIFRLRFILWIIAFRSASSLQCVGYCGFPPWFVNKTGNECLDSAHRFVTPVGTIIAARMYSNDGGTISVKGGSSRLPFAISVVNAEFVGSERESNARRRRRADFDDRHVG